MDSPAQPAASPQLRITALHIRGLKCIQKLDWPADGLGWGDRVPDTVVVGGANGSGKTTLLQFIVGELHRLQNPRVTTGAILAESWMDVEISSPEIPTTQVRILRGPEHFLAENATGTCVGLRHDGAHAHTVFVRGEVWETLNSLLSNEANYARSNFPSAVYLPPQRNLVLPSTTYKAAGALPASAQFIYLWQRPSEWKDSVEAVLYSARWADLNAMARHGTREMRHFEAYQKAFEAFFEGTKTLDWTDEGNLIVRISRKDAEHDLSILSDGEKQVIVLCAELLLRWRPGSLILIDEPELHLHSHWQARLVDMMERMQQERGGQVIMATQSPDIWRFAPAKSSVLLGGGIRCRAR